MLPKESIWLKNVIRNYIKRNTVVLNIGSSTQDFLNNEQSYIITNVINTIKQHGCNLINIDIKDGEGVDMVGDVTNAAFTATLKSLNPSLIICANLLEHLESRDNFIKGLINLLDKNTFLIVTVPYVFPFHADPIDTMYRPDIAKLAKDFNGLAIVEAQIVTNGLYYAYTTKHLNWPLRIAGFFKAGIKYLFNPTDDQGWYFKTISTTCVVFKKP